MSLPQHLHQLPADRVERVCDEVDASLQLGQITARMELRALRNSRTRHDAIRAANALRHVSERGDLAMKIEAMLAD
jgi:hypothetical protein